MAIADRYRTWFEQECDSNDKMLAMLASVPESARSDERFQRALTLAAHLAACRENWLDRMIRDSQSQADWWPSSTALNSLPARYEALQNDWRDYLSRVDEAELARDFEFPAGGNRYRWNIEGQIMQLVGHAFYHRGQIALLVDALGGEAVDTDYLYWAYQREERFGVVSSE